MRDDKSCALDVLDIEYVKAGDEFQNSDFSMQSLLHMIKRAQNKECYHSNEWLDCYAEGMDGCYWHRLAMLGFIQEVCKIVCPEENQWIYDYEVKGMKRNDNHWQRLFLASKNVTFDIGNLWHYFNLLGNKEIVKNKNKLGSKVTFDASHFNKWIEGDKQQILKGFTKGRIVRLNRQPILLQGSQIDIVDHVHSFVCKSFMET